MERVDHIRCYFDTVMLLPRGLVTTLYCVAFLQSDKSDHFFYEVFRWICESTDIPHRTEYHVLYITT